MPNGPQTDNSNPFLGTSAGASLGYRFMIYEPLVMTNGIRPSEKGQPWLATAWEWADNFRKLTFTVRDKVTWSDGKPLTADDVAYTFDLMKKTQALNINAIPFQGISVKGTNQVELTFDSSQFVNQTKILNQFVIPKHIWSTVKDPSTWTDQTPVGSGPYTLKSFTPQTVTLTRRSSYWKDLPKVSELRYTSYNDNSAQTTALANGSSEWSFVFMPNYKQLFINKDAAHNKLWFPSGLGIHGLWLNTARKPLDNPALRRAINLVVDRQAIFVQAESTLYPEIENPTGIPLPAGDPYLAPDYKGAKLTVDVDKAKKELTDAGFTYAGDTLKDPSGKPVKITLADPSGWSDYLTGLSIIKDGLKKIGISAEVRTQTVDSWTSDVNNGNFDAVLHWTNSGATPYDMYENIMDGALLQPVGKAAAGGNFGRFKSDEATGALKQYASASDDATRTDALDKLQKIMVEQVPMVPTSAAPIGAEYNTRHWTGWPDESNPYGPPQPTQPNSLDVVLHLQPSS
ncbi:ABC transporter substrate-binding protein [Peterkaempfera griseoplana]|uniref:ABC transporter substrate-binding protein n=1 Tax=Peterkaempfera griseoplana TaxID=66896 RepID=UPI000D14EEFE|nr:ABC transporter substrate-binding protein [Peterkaempfera griseoplana]